MRDFRERIPDRGPTILYRIALAVAVAVGLVLAVSASAKEPRSPSVKREFQLAHPCPATGRTSGACPGFVKDYIKPLALWRTRCGLKYAVANQGGREGRG
jgi:hypothetical protein